MHFLAFDSTLSVDEVGKFIALLVVVATVAGSLYYAFRTGKTKAEEEKVRPYREAAEGWERLAKQQEVELKKVRAELAHITAEYDEVKKDYDTAIRLNMRLQGVVDELTSRVAALESIVKILNPSHS